MQTSENSIDTGLHEDPYATAPLKIFLVRFNRKLESLLELLQQEQETLINGNADEISLAAQSKLDYMQQLSDFIQNHFDAPTNKTSLEQSLKNMNVICVEKNLVEWNQSQELVQLCRELSDENSILLANRLKHTNSALDTLYSLTGTQQSKTYDDLGQSKHSHRSRQLASV